MDNFLLVCEPELVLARKGSLLALGRRGDLGDATDLGLGRGGCEGFPLLPLSLIV